MVAATRVRSPQSRATVRDVVVRRVPTVLTSGLYAVTALVGAAPTVAAVSAGFYTGTVALGAAIACFVIRLVVSAVTSTCPGPTPEVTADEAADTFGPAIDRNAGSPHQAQFCMLICWSFTRAKWAISLPSKSW